MRRRRAWPQSACALLALLTLSGPLGGAALAAGTPTWVVAFDSGTRVVREVAEALAGKGRSILESYPRGSELFLGLLSLFPERTRIAGIEWGMRLSLGHDPDRATDLDVSALAEWCVAQYPDDGRRYEAIVVGSPNGAVAHLAALLGAPFLTTSFGLTFRRPTIDPDDLSAYRRTAEPLARTILARNKGIDFEVVCHYDPTHDRSLVKVVDFLRVKLHEFPEAYRGFVRDRLAPGGKLILIDCAYAWPQAELSERTFLQIGGLGAISPDAYLAQWPVDAPIEIRRESEWGCPEPFADAVTAHAAEQGIDIVRIRFDRPEAYSLLVYDAYRACPNVRPNALMIDCFNHQNPRTNIETGIPSLWLPFNTQEGLALAADVLAGADVDTIHFTLLPSFARSPDTASLDAWIDLLSVHGALTLVGIRPDKFPADPLAPYRFARDMKKLREDNRLPLPLRLSLSTFESLWMDRVPTPQED
ncbi:MAG: hypothetical protein WBC63_02120 [Candidatus Bipolaricaulia bacterium]